MKIKSTLLALTLLSCSYILAQTEFKDNYAHYNEGQAVKTSISPSEKTINEKNNITSGLSERSSIKDLNSDQDVKDLELISNDAIKQLVPENDKRFDLSGIVEYKGNIYVIADKEWDNQVYRIDTTTTGFNVAETIELCIEGKIDFEGIDFCKDKFYIIDETRNDVYQGELNSCRLIKLSIPWERYNIDRTNWGNKGFEGIAWDCEDQLLFLAREREPRRIYQYDVRKNVITEPFAEIINSDKVGVDIADLKYENGALYVLERGQGLVTRIDIKTKEKRSVSFQHIVLSGNHRLYNNSNYVFGMAEALLLTKDQIWIGIDNNGDEVSDYGKTIGLKAGTQPAIMIFKRPIGF